MRLLEIGVVVSPASISGGAREQVGTATYRLDLLLRDGLAIGKGCVT